MPRKGKRCRIAKERWTVIYPNSQETAQPEMQPTATGSGEDPSPVQSAPKTTAQPEKQPTAAGSGEDPSTAKSAPKTVEMFPPLVLSWEEDDYPSAAVSALETMLRSEAVQQDFQDVERQQPASFQPCRGRGRRHRVNDWDRSTLTGKPHKLIPPEEDPDKKFVLIVGDSHLRAIADGYINMPVGGMSFGIMSTPGANASQLTTELLHADIQRTPDVICLLAPSNDLSTPNMDQAKASFARLLKAAISRCPKVFVLDFPPRLCSPLEPQEFLRQSLRQVAALHGVPYHSVADSFPLRRRELWSHDGIHLSDVEGMGILTQLMWNHSYRHLDSSQPVPEVSPRRSPPVRRYSPRIVVTGEVVRPRALDPLKVTYVGRNGKRSQLWLEDTSWDSAEEEVIQQQDFVAPLVLRACSVVLNPVWFDAQRLVWMEKLVPSCLDTPVAFTAVPKGFKKRKLECPTKPVYSKKNRWKKARRKRTSPGASVTKDLAGKPTPMDTTVSEETAIIVENPFQCLPEEINDSSIHQPLECTRQEEAASGVGDRSHCHPGLAFVTKEVNATSYDMPLECSSKEFTRQEEAAIIVQDPFHCLPEEINASSFDQPLEISSMECTRQDYAIAPSQRIQSVRASHSQGDARYMGSQNTQCTCMALTFLLYHNEGSHFDRKTLDRVLHQGNTVYRKVILQLKLDQTYQQELLTIEEMPKCISIGKTVYSVHMNMSDLRVGYLALEEGSPRRHRGLSLATQLGCLSQDISHAVLIVTPECFALFRDTSGRYGLFDSHSRCERGFRHPTGTAIMMTFSDLGDMVGHFKELFQDHGPTASYEFMPVSFEQDNSQTSGPSAHVPLMGPTIAFPRQQHCVEANIPIDITDDGPAKNLDVSKLSKQRRKRALARAKTCHNNQVPPGDNDQRITRQRQHETLQYRKNVEMRLRKLQAMKTKYANERQHREEKKKYITRRYKNNLAFQSKHKKYMRDIYRTNPVVQKKRKKYMRDMYRTNPVVKNKKIRYTTDMYRTNPVVQKKRKKYMRDIYRTNPVVKNKKLKYMSDTYRSNPAVRSKKMKSLLDKYHHNPEFRLRHIQRCTRDKKTSLSANAVLHIRHKLQCALRIKWKYMMTTRRPETPRRVVNPVMEAAISSFRERIKHGPTFVCTTCNRTLFPEQVKCCNRDRYIKNIDVVNACLTGKYVHVCDGECSAPCTVPQERMKEWICFCCDSHLIRGGMPSIAVANNLELASIPPELEELNVLERQLIAKILPFAKIVALPRGRQQSIHGAVITVPAEMEAAVNSLPRPNAEAKLLQVKLKRNIRFKGYQHFYTVDMANVLQALHTLKRTHSEYSDIVIIESATFDILQDDEDLQQDAADAAQPMEPSNPEGEVETTSDATHEQPDAMNNEQDDLRPGLALDTCMQPPDIAQEVLSYGDGIFSIAPAQRNTPVGFFSIPKLEAMAFPVQFPTGQNTLDQLRKLKTSPSLYFNTRLLNVDTRFAKDQTYLFFAQFVVETNLASGSMSIQTRKGKNRSKDGRRISSQMIQDKIELDKLIQNEDATRFMQPLRGTPAYWLKALRDLHALCRQLGKPTFFVTFSAAEMRWPEFIEIIKAQQGETVVFSELDWLEKCDILRGNPVTVMRLFEKRVDALMRDLIMSPAQPIGQVEDYFFRVEFQARGSPHIHMVVWVKDAPLYDGPVCSQNVVEFIDRYISCKMPDEKDDPELHKIVSEVQVHSKNHSKTCRKGNVACRFGFPKLPMDRTVITTPPEEQDGEEENTAQSKTCEDKSTASKKPSKKTIGDQQKEARDKLKPLRDLLMDPNASFTDLKSFLEKCNMTREDYMYYVDSLTTGMAVMLKREPKDCWVNGYNPDLLRAWNANMDIQYVLDDYSCIAYMMSYISKPEHEMTEFLNTVIREVKKTNVNERDEMKQIMQAYAKNREVSAQEAVARVCSLPLKKCTRSVIFIQTDEDGMKMSKPMATLKTMAPEDEDVWMLGLPERYLNRPATPQFTNMCLAEFASEYRVLYGRQTQGKNAICLQNNKGFIQKRTRGKPAIIRFTRFSEKKNPEKMYRRMVKLYLPHRTDEELKLTTYEELYIRKQRIVDFHMRRYEGKGKNMQKALEQFQQEGPILNAWNTFAPEVEAERLECVALRKPVNPDEEDEQDEVPDFQVHSSGVIPAFQAPTFSQEYLRNMYRSLNEKQSAIFYTVREWCCKRVWGHKPEPFYYFISGGAGCGKSHVIKCVHQEATKILRQLPRCRSEADMSQPTVLLTAFTGTAAFNINGKTLHSLLKLPRNLRPPYQGLGNSLDEVRAALSNAEILIIDEISMLSKELFAYVHWRLQQIKGNKKPFGGMSVLTVGDYHQLPPIGKAKPLCICEDDVLDLWKAFQIVNLTDIMRQKDDKAFAEALNRIRFKKKTDQLNHDDKAMLTQAVANVKDCPLDALYIFATNKEVDEHNATTVTALNLHVVNIPAEDYIKDIPTGEMIRSTSAISGNKRDLPNNIQAAEGARVMVVRNLDTEDGIVNGTFGTIVKIVTTTDDGPSTVKLLGLTLDNPTAGQRFRKKIQGSTDELVYIEKYEESLGKRGLVRRQFPLKLAFGCTAHKVQGMTLTSAVVSLKRVFEAGMAYVALSRTTSLAGLKIIDFNEDKIYSDANITQAVEKMTKTSFESTTPLLHFIQSSDDTRPTLTIIHHNIEGLSPHIEDMKSHHEIRLADVVCLTETHLSGTFLPPNLELEEYEMHARNRHLSYTNRADMATKSGGGVAMYYRRTLQAETRRFFNNVTDLEFAVLKVEAPVRALIATVYRPPNFNLQTFLPNMQSLLDSLDMMDCQPVIVCGDFNEDLHAPGKNAIQELFQSKGYSQLISTATTEKQTLIDHIYISKPASCLKSGVLQTYYSYHSPIYCILA